MEDIQYRKLVPKDSKDYRNLRLESLQKHPNYFGSIYEEQKLKLKLAFENYIEESNPERFIMGAYHLNRIIGISGFYINKDERCKHRGEIIQTYVQQNYQNNNIGSILLKTTINEAFKIRKLEQIELEVISNNRSANDIYEKVGLKEYGLHKNFYKIDETYLDLKLMVLYRKNIYRQ